MDGGKRCENANVDVNTFMRFQKCISVDGALHFLKTPALLPVYLTLNNLYIYIFLSYLIFGHSR